MLYRLPVPGQQLIEPGSGMLGDAGEDDGKPGLRVDVIKLGGGDQRVDRCGAFATAVGTGEQP